MQALEEGRMDVADAKRPLEACSAFILHGGDKESAIQALFPKVFRSIINVSPSLAYVCILHTS